jgi:hypothetical protein
MGPMLLGTLARISDDAGERRAALAEALLAAGSVSHNYLWFYHEAIETALSTGEWDASERYAAALESYTWPEPAAARRRRAGRDAADAAGVAGSTRRGRGDGPGPGRERSVGIRCEFW